MINYLLESTLSLGLLWLCYHFLLSGLHSFVFNRFFLLGSLVFGFLIPFVNVQLPVRNEIITFPNDVGQAIPLSPYFASPPLPLETSFPFMELLVVLYGLVVVLKSIQLGKKLLAFRALIQRGHPIAVPGGHLILVPWEIAPHTFLKYVFVNREQYYANEIAPEILEHEMTHLRQHHSWDTLFVEAIGIIFWFQPLLRLYKHAIRLNHELLSDHYTLRKYPDRIRYQKMLLTCLTGQTPTHLASPLNFFLTKKRFMMINALQSEKGTTLKKLLAGTVFLWIFLGLGVTTYAQQEDQTPPVVPTRENAITEKEKPLPPPPHPGESRAWKKNPPTAALLEKWTDAQTYGVWLDGGRISNQVLKNEKAENFAWYMESRLLKNAKNYGKHVYQVNLYSETYFNEHLKDLPASMYRVKPGPEGQK